MLPLRRVRPRLKQRIWQVYSPSTHLIANTIHPNFEYEPLQSHYRGNREQTCKVKSLNWLLRTERSSTLSSPGLYSISTARCLSGTARQREASSADMIAAKTFGIDTLYDHKLSIELAVDSILPHKCTVAVPLPS